MRINFSAGQQKPKGVIAQVFAAIVGVVMLVGVAMLGAVFLAVLAVVGVVFWIYFWWKTRAIRARIEAQMRAQTQYRASEPASAAPSADGDVIEGEAVRVAETDRMLDRKNDQP